MLINAVKDVTSALGDLMQATKSASGKNMQHPAMHQLKDTAKVGVMMPPPLNHQSYIDSNCSGLSYCNFIDSIPNTSKVHVQGGEL